MTAEGIRIQIDPRVDAGAIRPLHGVNNGPICFGGLVDLSSRFQELRIPSVRLHDCEWPHPAVVDIPAIFPDLRADPEDPASYHLQRTDDYVQSIVDLGADIVYRLGTSIEHTRRKYHVHPPSDLPKWANICVHIIRHYNAGWANGFEHNIRYWEIWNEANVGEMMWSGTQADYFQMYEVTARAIKGYDATLMVGGPAAAGGATPFLVDFVQACRERSLPLDFCSWHTYTSDPFKLRDMSQRVRDVLDQHGFEDAENHLNEWNYNFDWRSPEARRCSFGALQGPAGASFTAFTLMLLQDSPVDVANYYTGDTSWWGLFDPYGVPRKTFYAFKAFANLLETPDRVSCEIHGADEQILACAGVSQDRNVLQMLLSNVSAEERSCRVQVQDPPRAGDAEISLLSVDRDHDLSPVGFERPAAPPLAFQCELPGHAVQLVRMVRDMG
jgi:xylan 1,4-beta-xylosidase